MHFKTVEEEQFVCLLVCQRNREVKGKKCLKLVRVMIVAETVSAVFHEN